MKKSIAFIASILFWLSAAHSAKPIKPVFGGIIFPDTGFKAIESGAYGCDITKGDAEVKTNVIGNQKIFLKDCLERGAGHYHSITIGLGKTSDLKPTRGVRLCPSTVGWLTLRDFRDIGLPWLVDIAGKGEKEVVLWQSFSDEALSSSSSSGLVAFAYKLTGNRLVLNAKSTCLIQCELEKKYREQVALQKAEYGDKWLYSGLYTRILKRLRATQAIYCGK